VHLGGPQLLLLALGSAQAGEVLAGSPGSRFLAHAFQAPTRLQEALPGRRALEALVARAFQGQEPAALAGRGVLSLLKALLAATDVVLRMAPAMAAQRRSDVHSRGTGSGLLALRLAAVEGNAQLTRSLLARALNRRLANVVLHDDPAGHLAAVAHHQRPGGTRRNTGLQLGAEEECTPPQHGSNSGAAAHGSRYTSCLALALACGQLDVAAELLKAGADEGHGWGTQHQVTLATAAHVLLESASVLRPAPVDWSAAACPAGAPGDGGSLRGFDLARGAGWQELVLRLATAPATKIELCNVGVPDVASFALSKGCVAVRDASGHDSAWHRRMC
jgi:hypothetical protein